MTEIIRSEGIVLRRRDFGETSRIVVAFTRESGKVQLLVKGARAARPRFGVALEPLTRAEFVFYWRENKDLYTVAEAVAVDARRALRDNAVNIIFGLAAAEAVDKLSGEGDADVTLYELLDDALAALDAGLPGDPVLVRLLYLLAGRLGLRVNVVNCAKCGKPTAGQEVVFVLDEGGVYCTACRKTAVKIGGAISPAVVDYIAKLLNLPNFKEITVETNAGDCGGALSLISRHLNYHTGLELKSLRVAGRL